MAVNIVTPLRVTLTGAVGPSRNYVGVRPGTAVVSSSDRLTVSVPGEQPAVIEMREEVSGTFQHAPSDIPSYELSLTNQR